MSNMLTIMKKELFRFFHDKRMVFTVILMPGLMIYLMYSLMGSAIMSQESGKKDYRPTVYAINMPDELKSSFDTFNVDYQDTNISLDEMKNAVKDKSKDLIIEFPENFMSEVAAYDSTDATMTAPEVKIYYNAAQTESSKLYSEFTEVLNQFESGMTNKFDINKDGEGYNLASDKDTTGKFMSSMFPFLIVILLVSSCISIAPESIAGEKERGTLTTILVTPIKRSELALGKIFSLSIIAILSGCSSFIGIMLSLPKLFGEAEDMVNAAVYGVGDYVMILLVLLSTVVVMISAISLISAYAKNVKEAGTYVTPFMLIVALVGISSMFSSGTQTDWYFYLIPLYNSVQCMTGIFNFDVNVINVLIATVSNIVVSGVLVYILARLFNNEKIVSSK